MSSKVTNVIVAGLGYAGVFWFVYVISLRFVKSQGIGWAGGIPGDTLKEKLVEEARQVGYRPLLAEALLALDRPGEAAPAPAARPANSSAAMPRRFEDKFTPHPLMY